MARPDVAVCVRGHRPPALPCGAGVRSRPSHRVSCTRDHSVHTPDIAVLRLGRTVYADALALQRDLHARRKRGERGDLLLLTEHEPVLTLGRGADRRHILADDARLAALGVDVVSV